MIDYWHHPVVRSSVCNAVHCGFPPVPSRCTVQDQKLYTSVSIAANFLFVRSDTFAVGSFSYKMYGETRVQENANVSRFDF